MIDPDLDSLLTPLFEAARETPNKTLMVFVDEDGTEKTIDAAQLVAGAAGYAQQVSALGLGEKDLIIIALPHRAELLPLFLGVMLMRGWPSIFPYMHNRLDPVIFQDRLRALVANAQAKAIITTEDMVGSMGALLEGVDCLITSVDSLAPDENSAPPDIDESALASGDDVALLIFSSGTTGMQKGVPFTHHLVLNQLRGMREGFALDADDVSVSWLPLYHDMGLICGLLLPIVAGVKVVLLSPFQWVRDPKIMFWAIHKHRGTFCYMPNFAYNHSALSLRDSDLEGLDLSHFRTAINGSEPVRHESHQMFLERFGPYGWPESAMRTGYGMTENVGGITISRPGEPARTDWIQKEAFQTCLEAVPAEPESRGAMAIVSCGVPIRGTDVSIMDDKGQPLADRHIGMVAIRGNSLFKGYYLRPDLTEKAFRDGWFYTGDMGYMADGELYLTGRQKDLMIVGGKNIYPQDVEAIADSIPGIRAGRTVAFGMPDERLGTERIVMICELDKKVDDDQIRQIDRELRQRVMREMDVTLGELRLLKERWVIKTTGAKIARQANREKWLAENAASA